MPEAAPLRRRTLWLIVIGIAVRAGLAIPVGLGVDESYMIAVGRRVSLSYFDHPPLAFWLAHGASVLLGSESHLVVRLPFLLLFAGTTWLMYRLGAPTFGPYAGWIAALLLNVSAVFSASTASWVLPDGPLMFGLVASACCLVRVLFDPKEARHAWQWWLAAGACAGLAALSKYQASLFLAGVLLFLMVRPAQRRWLRRPEPYAALLVTLLMFAPVLAWNASHEWVSIAFQLGRGGTPGNVTLVRRLGSFGQNIAGQIAWVLPWIWVILAAALVRVLRRRPADDREWFFACLALVPIALFSLVSLGGQPGLPHWPASGYLFLFPLAGNCLFLLLHGVPMAPGTYSYKRVSRESVFARHRRQFVLWSLVGSVLAFPPLLAFAASAAITGWPARVAPSLFRKGDPTLEALDWSDLRPGLDSLGVLPGARVFVAGTSWVQSGKIAYALGPAVPVVCLSDDPRGFQYVYDQRGFEGDDAVIVDRLPTHHDVMAMYGAYFERLAPAGQIGIRRDGLRAFDVAVYVGRGFRGPYPHETVPANGHHPQGPVATGPYQGGIGPAKAEWSRTAWNPVPGAGHPVGDYLPRDAMHSTYPELAP
jgi:4-amino-4-deoxy-L-arabinose transferase-like glycosyltransferase